MPLYKSNANIEFSNFSRNTSGYERKALYDRRGQHEILTVPHINKTTKCVTVKHMAAQSIHTRGTYTL